jgi:hypothetical protein
MEQPPHKEQGIENAGDAQPGSARDTAKPAGPSDIRPEDATPKEDVQPPEPDEPAGDHVVEEKQQDD